MVELAPWLYQQGRLKKLKDKLEMPVLGMAARYTQHSERMPVLGLAALRQFLGWSPATVDYTPPSWLGVQTQDL